MSDTSGAEAAGRLVDDAADAVRDAAGDAAELASEQVEKGREAVSSAVGGAVGAATDAVQAVGSGVSDRVQQVARSAQRLAGEATEAVQNYPLRSVLITAGVVAVVGFVAGFLVARRD